MTDETIITMYRKTATKEKARNAHPWRSHPKWNGNKNDGEIIVASCAMHSDLDRGSRRLFALSIL